MYMYVHFPVSLFVRVDVPTLNFLWVWLALCHIVRTPPNLNKKNIFFSRSIPKKGETFLNIFLFFTHYSINVFWFPVVAEFVNGHLETEY